MCGCVQEEKKQQQGDKKTSGAPAPKSEKPAWAGKHPWKPFDRDTDLDLKGKPKDPQKLLQATGNLGNKFSSGGNSRSFL